RPSARSTIRDAPSCNSRAYFTPKRDSQSTTNVSSRQYHVRRTFCPNRRRESSDLATSWSRGVPVALIAHPRFSEPNDSHLTQLPLPAQAQAQADAQVPASP